MAVLLVDYENVSMKNGLKGIEYLNANDRLIIFYSQCCPKIRAANIEKALIGLNSPADSRRKEILCEKSGLLDPAAEYGKYEERNAMRARIKDALLGTRYENRTAEIIDFATASDVVSF